MGFHASWLVFMVFQGRFMVFHSFWLGFQGCFIVFLWSSVDSHIFSRQFHGFKDSFLFITNYWSRSTYLANIVQSNDGATQNAQKKNKNP